MFVVAPFDGLVEIAAAKQKHFHRQWLCNIERFRGGAKQTPILSGSARVPDHRPGPSSLALPAGARPSLRSFPDLARPLEIPPGRVFLLLLPAQSRVPLRFR